MSFRLYKSGENIGEYIKEIQKDTKDNIEKVRRWIMICLVIVLMFLSFSLGMTMNKWSCYKVAENMCNIQCNEYVCNRTGDCLTKEFIFSDDKMRDLPTISQDHDKFGKEDNQSE